MGAAVRWRVLAAAALVTVVACLVGGGTKVTHPTLRLTAAHGAVGRAVSWKAGLAVADPVPNGGLNAVSCVPEGNCEAAGFYNDGLPITTACGDGPVCTGPKFPLAMGADGRGWREQSIGPLGHGGMINGISCRSASFCMAVGYAPPIYQGTLGSPLAEMWNGSTWRRLDVAGPLENLQGVACSTAHQCIAVGYAAADVGTYPVSMLWNGSQWTSETVPAPDDASLAGVACGPTGTCIAVGDSVDSNDNGYTLVETWNGTSWTPTDGTPNVPGAEWSFLTAVSCADGTCMAVGYTFAGVEQPFTERFDGSSWTLEALPEIGSGDGQLFGVSCTSPSACTAVGAAAITSNDQVPSVYRWNGAGWTAQPVPVPTGTVIDGFDGVSCLSDTSCTAVGWANPGGGVAYKTLANSWNGEAWSIQPTPQGPGVATRTSFVAISCPTATLCVAIGNTDTFDGQISEIERRGQWSIVPLRRSLRDGLVAVSCASATFCLAVGEDSSTGEAVAEEWNGTRWRLVRAAIAAAWKGSVLHSVSCWAADACMAVGEWDAPRAPIVNAVSERWNGHRFTIEPVPAVPGTAAGLLYSVSCPASRSCTAVGDTYPGSVSPQPLEIEHWDGRRWSAQAGPSPTDQEYVEEPTGAPTLTSVSCPTSTRCVAVGNFVNAETENQPFELSWNGRSWTYGTREISATRNAEMTAVSCSTPRSCTAVGIYTLKLNDQAFAAHWNGTTWHNGERMAVEPNAMVSLQAIECAHVAECLAVGGGYFGGVLQPIVERRTIRTGG